MNLKKKLSNYFTKRLNKKMNQEKVGEYKYFKLANGKFLLKTDLYISKDNKVRFNIQTLTGYTNNIKLTIQHN